MNDGTFHLGICDGNNSITEPGHMWRVPNDPTSNIRECFYCGMVAEGSKDMYGHFGADRVLR